VTNLPISYCETMLSLKAVGVKSGVKTVSFEEYIDLSSKLGAPRYMAVEIYEQMKVLHALGPEAVAEVHGVEGIDIRKVSLY
jgi:hypothetical protein